MKISVFFTGYQLPSLLLLITFIVDMRVLCQSQMEQLTYGETSIITKKKSHQTIPDMESLKL